ncbi:MAG: hypothetical protein ACQ9MH_04995 [Nitrospinales bacterium]
MSTRCSTSDIADKLVKARKDKKGVTLILGKECSELAGIPTSEEYVAAIKEKFPQAYEKTENKDLSSCVSQLNQEEKSELFRKCVDSKPVNWTHICVALLLKNGFADRVLTVNADPLLRKACSLIGEFPPVFDCALEQIKDPNHIPQKSIINLYGQEIGMQPGSLDGAFNDTGNGPWIVAGHNGQKDLVHDQLKKAVKFDEGLHWVFSNGAENKKSVVDDILTKEKNGFHVSELNTDSFFIALTQKLKIFPPEIILHPFTHLGKLLNGLAAFPIPGQKEGFAITDLLLLQTQSSIEQFEEVEAGAEDFGANQDTSLLDDEDHLAAILEARNGLLMGDTAKILKHAKQYEETPSLQLGNLLHWAYITKGNPILNKALSQPKEEALALLEQAGEYFQAALGIHADDQEVLIKYGKIITEQAKLTTGEEAEKLFALAAEKFNGILELNPNQHEASYNLGLALIEQANARSDDSSDELYAKAISGFENAVKGNPNHFDSYYGWGFALSAQARKKKGAEALRLFGQAAEKYQAALKIKPSSYEALLQMGNALMVFSKGKKKEEADRVLAMAEDKFQSAIKIRPDSHDAFIGMGEALHKRGIKGPADKMEEFLNKAIDNFKTALTLKPNFPRVNYNWGLSLSYLAEGKKGEDAEATYSLAAEKFQIAMKINPSNFEALTRWGNVIYQLSWFKSGKEAEDLLTQATEKYGAALKINPNHPEAFTSWGNVFLRLAQLSQGSSAEAFLTKAIEKYKLALNIKPESIKALSNWGNALFESAQLKSGAEAESLYAQAEEKFQGALKIQPKDFMALSNWGYILYKRGLGEPSGKGDPYFIKAQKCFTSALEIKPDYPDALKGMGESLIEQARSQKGINVHPLLAEAKAKLTKAEELQPGISTFNMALIMAMLANESECKSWLEKCLENGTLPNGETLMNDSRLANMRESKWFKVLAAPPVKSTDEANKEQETEAPEISMDEIDTSEPASTKSEASNLKSEPVLKTDDTSTDDAISVDEEPEAEKS